MYGDLCFQCENVLRIDPVNVQAYYRRETNHLDDNDSNTVFKVFKKVLFERENIFIENFAIHNSTSSFIYSTKLFLFIVDSRACSRYQGNTQSNN